MRYVRGKDENGKIFQVQDPKAEELNVKANVSDDALEVCA